MPWLPRLRFLRSVLSVHDSDPGSRLLKQRTVHLGARGALWQQPQNFRALGASCVAPLRERRWPPLDLDGQGRRARDPHVGSRLGVFRNGFVVEVTAEHGKTLLQPTMLRGRRATARGAPERVPAVSSSLAVPQKASPALAFYCDQLGTTSSLGADQVSCGHLVLAIHDIPVIVVVDPERMSTVHVSTLCVLLRRLPMVLVCHPSIIAGAYDIGRSRRSPDHAPYV